MPRTAATLAVAAVAGVVVAGCSVGHESDRDRSSAAAETESESGTESEDVGGEVAPDLGSCLDDLTAAPTPYPDGFPADWPWPEGTVVFDAEDRGDYGVVVSAATDTPFAEVLDFLNEDAQDAGFVVTSGETEESDAEADWAGGGYRGRWAIRASATCPGETTIQVLSTDD